MGARIVGEFSRLRHMQALVMGREPGAAASAIEELLVRLPREVSGASVNSLGGLTWLAGTQTHLRVVPCRPSPTASVTTLETSAAAGSAAS